MSEKISKSDAEWRAQLTADQYRVARERGTERAFTRKYWDHHEDGTYTCVACGALLHQLGELGLQEEGLSSAARTGLARS